MQGLLHNRLLYLPRSLKPFHYLIIKKFIYQGDFTTL